MNLEDPRGERALRSVREGGRIREGGIAVLEEARKSEVEVPDGCDAIDTRRYGDTQVSFPKAL